MFHIEVSYTSSSAFFALQHKHSVERSHTIASVSRSREYRDYFFCFDSAFLLDGSGRKLATGTDVDGSLWSSTIRKHHFVTLHVTPLNIFIARKQKNNLHNFLLLEYVKISFVIFFSPFRQVKIVFFFFGSAERQRRCVRVFWVWKSIARHKKQREILQNNLRCWCKSFISL